MDMDTVFQVTYVVAIFKKAKAIVKLVLKKNELFWVEKTDNKPVSVCNLDGVSLASHKG